MKTQQTRSALVRLDWIMAVSLLLAFFSGQAAAQHVDPAPNGGLRGLTVARHVDTTFVGPTGLPHASDVLQRCDRASTPTQDVACGITFQQTGGIGTFSTTGDGLDVVTTNAEIAAVLADGTAWVKVITSIQWCGGPGGNIIGCAPAGSTLAVVNGLSADTTGEVIAHEFGHNQGLGHRPVPPAVGRPLMRPNIGGDEVNQAECAAFHAGLVNNGPNIPTDFAPNISCPTNAFVECSATGGTPDSDAQLSGFYAGATAEDGCEPVPTITDNSPSLFPIGNTAVTFTAMDLGANTDSCIASVRVDDTVAPVIDCPASVTVECPAVPAPGTPTVNDVCGATAAANDNTTGTCNNAYSTFRTWTATDVGGNSAQCMQYIVAQDTTPPDLAVPADVTVECVDASGSPAVLGTPVTSDACGGGPISTNNDGLAVYPIGTTTVNWTAADCHGNATGDTQEVTVVDPIRYFSTSSNQWGGSYLYLRQQNVYGITKCTLDTTQFGGNFLSSRLRLDAMDVKEDGNLLFSTESNGQFGNLYFQQQRVYELDPGTGVITHTGLMSNQGLKLRELVAIDLRGDGTLVFSTKSNQRVRLGGRSYYLKHQNAYLFDPAGPSISLFFDGSRQGLRSIDALDAYPDGRIAISTTGNQSIRGTYLRHENAYLFDAGTFTLVFDGDEPGINTLDAMTLPDGRD